MDTFSTLKTLKKFKLIVSPGKRVSDYVQMHGFYSKHEHLYSARGINLLGLSPLPLPPKTGLLVPSDRHLVVAQLSARATHPALLPKGCSCWVLFWVLGQGAGFRGWKEVSSLFNKEDEQHLLERCKSPKSKVANLRLKEELKAEKKPGFWDNLVLKQSSQPKKPDEIEGWEPPKLSLEDVAMDVGDTVSDCAPRLDWEEDGKASNKYTSLAGSGSSSRWGLRSAGKLVGIRRPSRGHLTDSWEGLE
ncbi:testis development-related protein-like [Suncus etruscus]|uniref:testis development-related protein-like n=1 Tax=Suncus etruscus TaxID=109475 RepID=UPI0021103299|nr:testis development-related protein-like [Suncus etruscus]